MQIHRYPLSPILTMIVTMCQILITLGGNTWHFHQIISLVCVGGKLWGADRGKNSSFHSILLKVKIFIFVIDWSDPVKHKKSPIVIYNSLILANISEKRELIRKIVQAIDYRFRPYIKCNGSSRCLASIRELSPTGSWAVLPLFRKLSFLEFRTDTLQWVFFPITRLQLQLS